MIDISKGRYWDLPWSLVDGCTPCSPGCDHCWSAAMTSRFERNQYIYPLLMTKDRLFTGNIILRHERFGIPLSRRKNTVFAAWNDLFHEDVPDQFIYETTRVMKGRPWHTFLLLTKRPEKIRRLSNLYDEFPNVWSGLTVCNQAEMEEKGKGFFGVPGNKFLSLEPILSKVVIPPWVIERNLLSCVILGGETGPGARPVHPDWVRSVRNQCAEAGVSFFFKGWGEWLPVYDRDKDDPDFRKCSGVEAITKNGRWLNIVGGQGFHGDRVMRVDRIGKKRAGRLLDCRTHDDLPWATNVKEIKA